MVSGRGFMELRGFRVAAAVVLGALLSPAGAFAQPKAEAEIASITGQGEVREFQQRDWTAAKVKQALFASNYVRTLAMSRMALLYSDGTQEQLSANTVIQIIGTPGTQPASTRLERGRAWTQSKTTPTGVTMQTPWAAAAIRGTDWEMEVADNGDATLSVFSGEVEFYNEHGRVVVRPGEQAHVEQGKAPVKLRLQVSRERIQWVSSFTVDPRRYSEFVPEPSDDGLRAIAAAIRAGRLADAFDRVKARADSPNARAIDILLLADFHFYEGDIGAAEAAMRRGMERFPADARFDVGLARAALLHDDFPAAARHARAGLAKQPQSVDALVMLGEVERREGRAPEAISAYGQAARVAARDPRGWLGL